MTCPTCTLAVGSMTTVPPHDCADHVANTPRLARCLAAAADAAPLHLLDADLVPVVRAVLAAYPEPAPVAADGPFHVHHITGGRPDCHERSARSVVPGEAVWSAAYRRFLFVDAAPVGATITLTYAGGYGSATFEPRDRVLVAIDADAADAWNRAQAGPLGELASGGRTNEDPSGWAA